MSLLRVSLEQWQAFVTVVQEGGHANASRKLHKSQPTLSYLIKKTEDTLNVSLFTLVGRKSELTLIGKKLYFYAIKLITLAYNIEHQANEEENKLESEIRLVVDEIYPISHLMNALSKFSDLGLTTRIALTRGVLSHPLTMLQTEKADIAITFKYPHDFLAEHLIIVTSAPFAAINHPLHQLNRPINEQDLLSERQIILSDNNQVQSINFGFLSPHNAWYVDTLEMKLQMLTHGLGYAWLNEQLVKERGAAIKQLPISGKALRYHTLYIAYRKLGPAALMLIQILKNII